MDHCRGDDEPACGRAVRPQDDRKVAVDVDRPDRVAVVEDVRGMAAGDAPAPACPLEPVRLEPHARPVGVPVDGPLATEQRLHVVLGQIVRRRLRAAHGADLPGARIDGPGVRAKPAAAVTVRAGRSERQSVARLQRPAVEASERTHGVRGT